MRIQLFILLFLSQYIVLGQVNVYDCLDVEKFQFYNGAQLKQSPRRINSKIVDTGSYTVFRLYRNYDCANVYDEDVSLTLLWQIPLGDTTFKINVTPSDSLIAPIYYSAGGTGPGRRKPHYYKWSNGQLVGRKNNINWQVDLNLEIFYFDVYTKSIQSQVYKGSYEFKPWEKRKDEISFHQWAW